jgi:hypothetical protein
MGNLIKIPVNKQKVSKLIAVLTEKELKMGKRPILKEWFEIRNKLQKLRRTLDESHD